MGGIGWIDTIRCSMCVSDRASEDGASHQVGAEVRGVIETGLKDEGHLRRKAITHTSATEGSWHLRCTDVLGDVQDVGM
jgi:hypothetical protein